MPKKAAVKAPKALKEILRPTETPVDNRGIAAVMQKGIASAAIESGQGAGALLSISNEGPATQISLASPFGRPALEPGQSAPPLLTPEDEGELPEKASQFDTAWAQVTAQTPKAPVEEETEEDPFVPEEEPPADMEPIDLEAILEKEIEPTEFLEEMAELRKANQRLREENNVLGNKNGATLALAELESVKEELEALKASQVRRGNAPEENSQGTPIGAGSSPAASRSLPMWESKDLRILFPCYKTTNPATAACLIALALDYGKEKIGIIPGLGDARIANSRNRLAGMFLETNSPWSIWIDDDMVLPVGRPQFIRDFIGFTQDEVPDAVLNVHVIERLMSHNQKLIGATYFGRRQRSPAMFKDGIDNVAAYDKAKRHTGELIPTDWVATGCLLVHRDVYLGIQKACPELAPNGKRTYWDFFQEGKTQEEGEDVMFCRRAKKAGFQPIVDTGAQCWHVGFQSFGFNSTSYQVPNQLGQKNWFQ